MQQQQYSSVLPTRLRRSNQVNTPPILSTPAPVATSTTTTTATTKTTTTTASSNTTVVAPLPPSSSTTPKRRLSKPNVAVTSKVSTAAGLKGKRKKEEDRPVSTRSSTKLHTIENSSSLNSTSFLSSQVLLEQEMKETKPLVPPVNIAAAQAVAPTSDAPHRSTGPVVSEEWARSIIKPGDEKLLYHGTAGIPSPYAGMSPSGNRGAMGSLVNRRSSVASSGNRTSPYDPQLRRAQREIQMRRQNEERTPGGHSTATSRHGSTKKRSESRRKDFFAPSTTRESATSSFTFPQSAHGHYNGSPESAPHLDVFGGTNVTAASSLHGGSAERGSVSPTPTRLSGGSFTPLPSSRMSAEGIFSGMLKSSAPVGPSNLAYSRESCSGAFASSIGMTTPRNFAATPPPSPSMSIFARPVQRPLFRRSPREPSTPWSFGNYTGMSSMMSSGSSRFLTGASDELLKLTKVREELLHRLWRPGAVQTDSTTADNDKSGPPIAEDTNDVSLPSLLTMRSAPDVSQVAELSSPTRAAAKRRRERVFGVELQPRHVNNVPDVEPSNGEEHVPHPLPSPSSLSSTSTTGLQRHSAAGGNEAPNRTVAPTSSGRRPLLSVTSPSPAHRPHGSEVSTALNDLTSAVAVAERAQRAFLRALPSVSSAAPSTQTLARSLRPSALAAASKTASAVEEATRRLLLDPMYPLITDENYHRLVLKDEEVDDRKLLVAAFQDPASYQYLFPASAIGISPRPSSGPGPARALHYDMMDLVSNRSSDDASTPLPSTATTAVATVEAEQVRHSHAATTAGSMPSMTSPTELRCPALRYGHSNTGTLSPTHPSRSRSPPSPSPTHSLPPTRDTKLLVNAVMPSDKTGPIKPFAAGSVWYSATAPLTAKAVEGSAGPAPNQATSLTRHSSFSRSTNASQQGSPRRLVSPRPPASLNFDRGSTGDRDDNESDSASTVADDAVQEAEEAVQAALRNWGPCKTDAASVSSTISPTSSAQHQSHGVDRGRGRCRSVSKHSSKSTSSRREWGTTAKNTGALDNDVERELVDFVHYYMKRYRGGPPEQSLPHTPAELQQCIRSSLQLSPERSAASRTEGMAQELPDPAEDGSYHTQNVQYILDLFGAALQKEGSFTEAVVAPTRGSAAPRKPDSQGALKTTMINRAEWPEVELTAVELLFQASETPLEDDAAA